MDIGSERNLNALARDYDIGSSDCNEKGDLIAHGVPFQATHKADRELDQEDHQDKAAANKSRAQKSAK